MTASSKSAPVLGFEDGTRRRTIELNTIPFVDGQPQTLTLPNVGYAAYLKLQVFVTLTANGAVQFAGDAVNQLARAVLSRVVLGSNYQANIVTCSAHGLKLKSISGAAPDYGSDALTDEQVAAPTAAGTTTWWFEVIVPLQLNDGPNFKLGMINLQNDDITVNLRLEWATIASMFATQGVVTVASGYAIPELVYYDVPDLTRYDQPPLNYLVTTTETVDTIVIGTGEHVWPVPRGNTLVQVIHEITENGTTAQAYSPVNTGGKVITHEVRMQNSITDYRSHVYLMGHESRRRYQRAVPQGTIFWDNLWDSGMPGMFNLGYQMVDTDQYTKLDSVIAVQGMNPTTSKLRTIRTEIVRLDK